MHKHSALLRKIYGRSEHTAELSTSREYGHPEFILTLFESMVDIQQGQMISIYVGESHLGLVRRFLGFRGANKTLWD